MVISKSCTLRLTDCSKAHCNESVSRIAVFKAHWDQLIVRDDCIDDSDGDTYYLEGPDHPSVCVEKGGNV
jgi:hypothetical protein